MQKFSKYQCQKNKYLTLSFISNVNDLSLSEYCQACIKYCEAYHHTSCSKCKAMVQAANIIIEKGICSLASLYRTVFPDLGYKSCNAKEKLLRMPLVAILCRSSNAGNAVLLIMEYTSGVDYTKVALLLDRATHQGTQSFNISKQELRMLLSVAQTQREHQLISYGIVKSLGLSSKSAKHHFGITRVPSRIARVQQNITDMQALREVINQISHVKEKSILQTLGLDVDSEISESNESDTDGEYNSDTSDGGVSRQACVVSNEDDGSSDGGDTCDTAVIHQSGVSNQGGTLYRGGGVSCQPGGVSHFSGGGEIRDGGVDGVSHQSCQGADGVSHQGGGDSSDGGDTSDGTMHQNGVSNQGGTLYRGGGVSCQPGGVSHSSGGGEIRDGGVDGVSHQGGGDSSDGGDTSDGTMHQNGVSNQGGTLYRGGGVSCQPGGVSHFSGGGEIRDGGVDGVSHQSCQGQMVFHIKVVVIQVMVVTQVMV